MNPILLQEWNRYEILNHGQPQVCTRLADELISECALLRYLCRDALEKDLKKREWKSVEERLLDAAEGREVIALPDDAEDTLEEEGK